jgi:hypothetical protein
LVGVGTGVVATCVVFWLLFLVVGLPLFPVYLPEGVELPIGLAWYVHVVRVTLPPLASLLLTFFLGGLVVGVVVSAFAGLNGALSAATAAFGAFAWFVRHLLPWLWEPMSDHGEVYVLNEGLGTLIALTAIFCLVLPLIVLTGYLGARVGGRLRNGWRGRRVGRSRV